MRTRSGFVKVSQASLSLARTCNGRRDDTLYTPNLLTRCQGRAQAYDTNISRLPAELYREIFQHLSRTELVPLLAASCDIRVEAMRLYFDLVILEDDERRLIERFSKFRAYIGPFIKSLIITRLGPQNSYVNSILSSCPNLKHLGLHWEINFYPTARSHLLPHKPPFQLQTLMLGSRGSRKIMVDFVKTQRTSLTRLHTYIGQQDLGCVFPRLQVFGGHLELLASLSRSSDKLRCFEMICYDSRTVPSARFIRALRLIDPFGSLVHLSRILPDLQYMLILAVSVSHL